MRSTIELASPPAMSFSMLTDPMAPSTAVNRTSPSAMVNGSCCLRLDISTRLNIPPLAIPIKTTRAMLMLNQVPKYASIASASAMYCRTLYHMGLSEMPVTGHHAALEPHMEESYNGIYEKQVVILAT